MYVNTQQCGHWDNQGHTCTRLWQYTVDHIITDGIISAMLGLRMLQLLCRLPIKLHSYYIRINVRFELLATVFEHILIRHNIQ